MDNYIVSDDKSASLCYAWVCRQHVDNTFMLGLLVCRGESSGPGDTSAPGLCSCKGRFKVVFGTCCKRLEQ